MSWSPEISSSEPSFLETLSAMFTSTFNQTATSELTFTAPPRPPADAPTDKLNALGLETGVALLHNHVSFVKLNPIVADCHVVAADSVEGRKLNVPKVLAEFAGTPGASSAASTTSPTDSESYGANLSGWIHYSVTDSLPHPFGLPGTTVLKYVIALRNEPDGFESLVAAAGGVMIHGGIKVVRAAEGRDGMDGYRERGEKKLWLQEWAEVRCWVGTGWYVSKTMRDSHDEAHERFRAWWEKEVRSKMGN
jgi:hypothetical protein